MARPPLRVGLVGSGFMGRAHALAFGMAGRVFDLPLEPVLELLADANATIAAAAAERLGFRRASGDWRQLVADPAVDLVAIAAPNVLHKPVALAALAAGKPVYCEKPLAVTLNDARDMAMAARAAKKVTLVGFNYLKNPVIALARDIIAKDEIGKVIGFRGIHAEDYMADPDAPFAFRHEPQGGGAFMDLGSHIVSMARYLIGDIAAIAAASVTVHESRPVKRGASARKTVTVDDQMHAVLRFASGVLGTIEASWVTPGRKMQLAFEITGTKGSLSFTQERFNELKLYRMGRDAGREGYTTIAAGPEHPPYGEFIPAPGHQLGFNDLKVIEVKALIDSLAGKSPAYPDFAEAAAVQAVIDAGLRAASERRWVTVEKI